jgi:hypothetical protein
MGARPELEIGKVKGETYRHASWLPQWFEQFLNAPVIKPDYKLADVLYPSLGNEENGTVLPSRASSLVSLES